jgi:hypothetical protein
VTFVTVDWAPSSAPLDFREQLLNDANSRRGRKTRATTELFFL